MNGAPDDGGWKEVHRRYVALERTWSMADAPEPVARQFFRRIVHGHRSKAAIEREFHEFGLQPPSPAVLEEAFCLQRLLCPTDRDRPGGRHPDDPLEDVYAAALSMLPHGFWVESPERDHLYRGQRDARWPTVPALFRRDDVDAALGQLAQAVTRVRECLPAVSDAQALAVAQHYSRELGVATWLLDMTYDPRVALFFASDGGVGGEVGVVSCLVRKTWDRLSAAGSNRLGRLRVIDVPGVLRIEQQRASFLDTSHPVLFDQYVADTVWFRQQTGLRFEDPDADFPVTAASIYPSLDPVLTALIGTPPSSSGVLRSTPAGDAREPLHGDDYWEIAQSWCRREGLLVDAYHEDSLRVVCDVHARLQEQPDQFALPERSLARLQDAVDLVIQAQRNGRFITAQEALCWSLACLPPPRRVVLQDIIAACAHARDSC
ncbi:FRG domain-containing protein [Accumulibacter sp.]|uniref:FRG domain-containing protein n=1 Tax=Accumulibacter sp. TaxID=2053492 RepID=UPI0035B40E0B